MAELISQIVTSLGLILGIVAGGTISTKAFGVMKNGYQYLIEVIMFIAVITLVLNSVQLTPSVAYNTLIFFVMGTITIVSVRTITSAAGYGTKKVRTIVNPPKSKSVTLAVMIRNLRKKDFSDREILEVFENTDFKKKEVKKALENSVFERIPRKK